MNTRDREPIRPGEHLKEYGVTPYKLAKETGMSATTPGDIINKGRAITADTAMRLGKFFGVTAQFWMNLQTSYDLKKAEMQNREVYENIKQLAA